MYVGGYVQAVVQIRIYNPLHRIEPAMHVDGYVTHKGVPIMYYSSPCGRGGNIWFICYDKSSDLKSLTDVFQFENV